MKLQDRLMFENEELRKENKKLLGMIFDLQAKVRTFQEQMKDYVKKENP